MTERREQSFRGIAAAPGLAAGPVHRLHARARLASDQTHDDPLVALRAALAKAGDDLQALISTCNDSAAADILEFQLALLDDDELIEPVIAEVQLGTAAGDAWRKILDDEIRAYTDAGDEILASRASDLADLRERVLLALSGQSSAGDDCPEGAILIADDLAPSRFVELAPRLAGIALQGGSATSHVSILARARGLPLVVALPVPEQADICEDAILDGTRGFLTLNPDTASRAAFTDALARQEQDAAAAASFVGRPALTASGERVDVLVNIDDVGMLGGIDPAGCDGAGLVRSEFLFAHGLPSEDEQLKAYTRILGWAAGRPVVVRTIDAGGDKPIPGLTLAAEANPFLGMRGIRLSLARPEVFQAQLRALARAARLGPLSIMLPMLTDPGELDAARRHLVETMSQLGARGIDHGRPALGIMVETPACALRAAAFKADFYSIGSNDLIQYVTACARDEPRLAHLTSGDNPAITELIERVADAGRARGVPVSVCGDMASEPAMLHLLLRCGIRKLSVAPAMIGPIKRAIAEFGET